MPIKNEVFDIVDATDKVVDEASRSLVHERGLLHRAVHVYIEAVQAIGYCKKGRPEKTWSQCFGLRVVRTRRKGGIPRISDSRVQRGTWA